MHCTSVQSNTLRNAVDECLIQGTVKAYISKGTVQAQINCLSKKLECSGHNIGSACLGWRGGRVGWLDSEIIIRESCQDGEDAEYEESWPGSGEA